MIQEMFLTFGIQKTLDLLNRNNGYSLDYTPRGQRSVLFYSLINVCFFGKTQALKIKSTIYFDEFLYWFGDWRKHSNDSIVLDKYKEPLLVYRSVRHKSLINAQSNYHTVTYFTDSRMMASTYNDDEYKRVLANRTPGECMKVGFINIKHARIINAHGRTYLQAVTSRYTNLHEIIISATYSNKFNEHVKKIAAIIHNCHTKRIHITDRLSKIKLKRFIDCVKINTSIEDLINIIDDWSVNMTTDDCICNENVIIKNVKDYAMLIDNFVSATDYIINDMNAFKSICDLNI